jgi:hypothetical protein
LIEPSGLKQIGATPLGEWIETDRERDPLANPECNLTAESEYANGHFTVLGCGRYCPVSISSEAARAFGVQRRVARVSSNQA